MNFSRIEVVFRNACKLKKVFDYDSLLKQGVRKWLCLVFVAAVEEL